MIRRNWFDLIRNNKFLIEIWALITFLLVFRLETVPRLWLDEGWIMTVARNLVEVGHYGRLMNGVPYPETIINIGIPVIAPISLSFFLFGVGILQARITIVLFTLVALFVFYKLVVTLYNSKIAIASLLVILILPFNLAMNPVFIGRQALGELPALFYLISGYLLFLLSERRSYAIIAAVIFWVLAILSKFQIMPFLCLGLLVPAIVMLVKHNHKQAVLFGLGLVGTILIVLIFGKWTPVFNSNLSKQGLTGLVRAIVLVPNLLSRGDILLSNFPYIAPVVLGIVYASIKLIRDDWNAVHWNHVIGIKISVISLISSWIVWFIALSVGWSRHLTIPLFLGSMFVALMIYDFTHGFQLLFRSRRGMRTMKKGDLIGYISSLLVLALISVWGLYSFLMFGDQYLVVSNKSVVEVANFINSTSDANALIETSDFELFVFLNRKYHFPPDEVGLELIENKSHANHTENIYNPLNADPDYIIVGPYSRNLEIYKELVESDQFVLIKSFPNYDVYVKEKVK